MMKKTDEVKTCPKDSKTLADYRPQHDENCASHCCLICRGVRSTHDFAVRTGYAVAHEWTPTPCSCGLDALLAMKQEDQQKNDEKTFTRSDHPSVSSDGDPRGDDRG